MDRHQRSLSSPSRSDANADADYAEFEGGLECPFGRIDCLGRCDVREAAYELLFMSCRSSPGFGRSKSSLNNFPSDGGCGAGESSLKAGMGMTVPHSEIKKALGLRARRSTPMRTGSPGKTKRPMTSAEIMRVQMRITEHSDNRLRNMLTGTFAGNMTRRIETIILPLELLRQLKPSEFGDDREYHQWQRRQLKILEAGLLHHPALPIDWKNPASFCLLEVIRTSEMKPLDTSRDSDAMRILCGAVLALAWRGSNGPASDGSCHWADGYPVNVNLYLALLRSIFDLQEETVVLDEVDELVELMKKTWSTLGINRMIHNVCFAWVFFQQYVETGQIEPDLISATVTMLAEVGKPERDANYVNLLFNVLTVMQGWAERKMLDYREKFGRGTIGNMENILALAISTLKIVSEDLTSNGTSNADDDWASKSISRVDYYIKSSMRTAFTRLLENRMGRNDSMVAGKAEDESTGILIHLAKATEELALFEKEAFSPMLKKWHPSPAAAAAATVHDCFGFVLKEYLAKVTAASQELVRLLISAGNLEKLLVRMAVEDSDDCEDSGKAIVRELVPYEVDSLVGNLIAGWIQERLGIGRDCVERAKEEESWKPKSKNEPYADSALDLMKLAKVTVDEFFGIPLGTRDNLVQVIADGLEALFQDYVTFASACGTKQSYLPSLPPLTRCNQESGFVKLWKRSGCRGGGAAVSAAVSARFHAASAGSTTMDSRPSASRGTQRLYIRLNTLHYLIANIHALDSSLAFSRSGQSPGGRTSRRISSCSHFEATQSAAQTAIQYVSEVAAYRLIFMDSRQSLYDGLYVGSVARSGIRPALRVLRENLVLMGRILTDQAQPVAVKEVMRATFEAYLMVLLAGGSERAFEREDYEFVLEDFHGLKQAFAEGCGEARVPEEVVEREAEVAEGIVVLMGLPTERLIEDFIAAAYEASGMGGVAVRGDKGGAARPKVPMPPTTGRWNRSDPNTVLRVLCYRNEGMASQFLKRTFELAKRR